MFTVQGGLLCLTALIAQINALPIESTSSNILDTRQAVGPCQAGDPGCVVADPFSLPDPPTEDASCGIGGVRFRGECYNIIFADPTGFEKRAPPTVTSPPQLTPDKNIRARQFPEYCNDGVPRPECQSPEPMPTGITYCPEGYSSNPYGNCVPDVTDVHGIPYCPEGYSSDFNGNCVPDVHGTPDCPEGQSSDSYGSCVADDANPPLCSEVGEDYKGSCLESFPEKRAAALNLAPTTTQPVSGSIIEARQEVMCCPEGVWDQECRWCDGGPPPAEPKPTMICYIQ